MIQIIIADDHEIVREGLKKIISMNIDMDVAGEASSGEELLLELRKKTYDIVILDISMPGMGGIGALKEIKRNYPKLQALILSMHPEEQYAVRMLKEGASGYITKDSVADQLIEAIYKVSSGGKYVSPKVAENLAFYVDSSGGGAQHDKLSSREFQVLCMIASGKQLTKIADELHLSGKTISAYKSRIMEKMNMTTNSDLTYYAIINGLL